MTTKTFLFTDIEGSTGLWDRQPDLMRLALIAHDQAIREVIADHDGEVFKHTGDGFAAVFSSAVPALRAALAAQERMRLATPEDGLLRIRIGIHTGETEARDGDYFGPAVNRAARLMARASGGQILVSEVTMRLAEEAGIDGVTARPLGEIALKDLSRPERAYELEQDGRTSQLPVRSVHKQITASVLSTVAVVVDGERVAIGSRSQRAVLAGLARDPGRVVSTDALIEVVWGEDPPPTAAATLQSYVSRLRKTLGTGRIVSHPSGYSLAPSVGVDASEFERLVGIAAEQAGPEAVQTYQKALACWAGPAFGDLAEVPGLVGAARRLEEIRYAATLRCAAVATDVGNPTLAIGLMEELVGLDPLREEAWLNLALAFHADGRQAEALRALDRYRSELVGVGLDAGPRVKEVEAQVFDAPAARVTSHQRNRGNIFPPRSRLFGRETELEIISELLERGPVTLVGIGGMGKTRLAHEVGHRYLQDHDADAWMVELVELEPAADVATEVARVLGLRWDGDPLDGIVQSLLGVVTLLILDNCEHVLDSCRPLVTALAAGGVRVLATSRGTLGVAGEQVVEVGPITVDEASAMFADRVPIGRAALADGRLDMDTVREICRRLDRMPLGIEMAAALVGSLHPSDILERLDRGFDLLDGTSVDPQRQRTLTGVIGWSYDTLDQAAKRIFVLLSVFPGEFSVADAEEVIGFGPVEAERVASYLVGLADRSLLRVSFAGGRSRFSMLSTIREFALIQDHPDREVAVARHARHVGAWMRGAIERYFGPDEAHAVLALGEGLPGIRAALQWAVEAGEGSLSAQLVFDMVRVNIFRQLPWLPAWSGVSDGGTGQPSATEVAAGCLRAQGASLRGDLEEARQLMERDELIDIDDERCRDIARLVAADVCLLSGDLEGVIERVERIDLEIPGQDVAVRIEACMLAALANAYSDEMDESVRWAERLRMVAEECAQPTALAYADYATAEALAVEDPAGALAHYHPALENAKAAENRFAEGVVLVGMSAAYSRLGDQPAALEGFSRMIGRFLDSDDFVHLWTGIRNLAPLLGSMEMWEEAAVLLGAVSHGSIHSYGMEAAELTGLEEAIRSVLEDPEPLGRARGWSRRQVAEYALEVVERSLG